MNQAETARVLAVVQAFDNRSVGEINVAAWQRVLRDINFEDAQQAVIDHYCECRDWIMPADVRSAAIAIARHREGVAKLATLEAEHYLLEEAPTTPMGQAEWEAFCEQAKRHGVDVKLGRPVPKADPTPPRDPKRTAQALAELDAVRARQVNPSTAATRGDL